MSLTLSAVFMYYYFAGRLWGRLPFVVHVPTSLPHHEWLRAAGGV